MASPEQPPVLLSFGSFVLDEAAGELRENGVSRRLHPQAFRVLVLLAGRSGQVVSRQEIRQWLWGERKYLDFEGGINFSVNQIRSALRDSAETSRYIRTLPRRGYCFTVPPSEMPAAAQPTSHPPQISEARRVKSAAIAALLAASLTIPGGDTTDSHRPPLSAKDTVVIADFANTTGDGVFDDTLKQALTIALRQSPFLNVLPDSKARATLRMMGRADQRMTPQLSREVCLRTGSQAALDGSISVLGRHYVVDVNAIACSSGETLVNEQVEAGSKEAVLSALSRAASRLRAELGESLPSVQKFDAPVEATTSSLDALQSYSTGLKVLTAQGDAPSVPFYRRAIELDPDFSMAYVALASRYNNLNQPSLALDYARKAYELRGRGTERERLLIATRYLRLTGELEKNTQTLEMWMAEYPGDASPHGSLGANYVFTGQYAKALAEWREALRLDPDNVAMYENLAPIYLALNRLGETQAVLQSALDRKLDGGGLRWDIYDLAFVQRNEPQMRQQLDWAMGKPGSEDILLSAQSDTEAYFGHLGSARGLSRSAVESAIRSDYKEAAALWKINAALRDAEFGDTAKVGREVRETLALDSGRNVRVFAALALARIGETATADALADELYRDHPMDTMLAVYRLPCIRAAAALASGDPMRALELLEPVKPYELGEPPPSGLATLYPAYLRGQAYLAMQKGEAAAGEFKKILDHPGIALNFPIAALAHLQLGRALAAMGAASDAMREYLEFLTLWKEADSHVPVLAAARAEYARLKRSASRLSKAPRPGHGRLVTSAATVPAIRRGLTAR